MGKLYVIIAVILFILLLILIYTRKSTENYDNPSYCDFDGPTYSPNAIQTTGDSSGIGKLIRLMVQTALKTNLPKVANLSFQLFNCPTSTLNDINVCGNYGADLTVGSIKILNIKNLFDSLSIGTLKQIQSFPIDSNTSPGQGMKQFVFAVLPIGFDADVYVNVDFNSGIPIPNYDNTLIKLTCCASVYFKLTLECPTKSSSQITNIEINPHSGIHKLNINITNGDLDHYASIGAYLTHTNITDSVKNAMNSALSTVLYSHLLDSIKAFLPYTIPLPACVSVPGNTIKNSAGVQFTGLLGYRPTYPAPNKGSTDWQKCSLPCFMGGVGTQQQCLDACADMVDSSPIDTVVDCANKSNLGFFQVNDRSGIKNGVSPNGPLWPKVCTTIAPSVSELVPDPLSGYQWYQTVDKYVPSAYDGLLPALTGKYGVRGTLGEQIGNTFADCRTNCVADSNCTSFAYVESSDASKGLVDGTCFKSTGSPVLDSSFITYTQVP